jgi:surfeit locus 1 family protein
MRFKSRLIAALAVLACTAMFIYLGAWQSGKGERLARALAQRAERGQLGPLMVKAQRLDAMEVQDAPLRVAGTYDAAHQIFLDNRQHDGQPGVHVITPLKIEGTDTYIMINRGWVGWQLGRTVLPVVATPTGRVDLTGLAMVPSTKKFFLIPDHADERPQLWERLDISRFASLLGHPLQPVVLQQTGGDAPDSLIRQWAPPEDRVAKHRGYAFQWYGMAVVLLILALAAAFRKAGRP